MKRIEIIGLVACAVAAAFSFECGTTPSCDADAGCVDASSVPPVSGGGCDSSKPPSQGGCAVDDSDGFFVSPTGSDTGVGSKAAPFQTIGRGILAAAGNVSKPNVYVCHGTYPENLVIQTAPAGVALHGGFDCTSWTQMSLPTEVAPKWSPGTAPQYVLDVIGAAALVESMTLTAPDATDPGASSVAAFVNGSPGMTFRRAAVTSGRGADAISPTAPSPAAANANGNPAASDSQPGAAKACSCASDTTTGGAGGEGPQITMAPQGGLPQIPNEDGGVPPPGAGPGGNGANGVAGSTGASATTIGVLSANGWTSQAGGAGGVGGTAQGGAGGGYQGSALQNAGGGGACGGCGGQGGVGAPGGGASVAIAALNSTLRIQASTVHAGTGGTGADGAAGQAGQPGGTGGASSAGNSGTCPGGGGGTGGAGGPGGGGAGGSSVAVATVGTTPDVDAFSTVLAGTPGKGGHDGANAVKAVDGVAEVMHSF